MEYPCNSVFVILLVLVISNHNLVSSFELENLSNNEETGQPDSTASSMSKETSSSVLIIEKLQHNLENNTLSKQNETKLFVRSEGKPDPPEELFPFTKLMFKPVFHMKRVENINDDTENNKEVPRFLPRNNVPYFLDINGRRTPARPLIHRSIFMTKLINPRGLPRLNHYVGGFKPISSVDPGLGLLDRMMHDLMVPLLNDMPLLDNFNMGKLDNKEDSSLKFWMQNENRNKPNPWHIRETPFEVNDENDSSEDVGNGSLSEEDPDYKSDLWKKFMKDEKNKQDTSDYSSDSKQNTEHATLDSKPFVSKCQNCKSFDNKINENIVKEEENEWWTRLVLPWKRPIYKDHKKSSHQYTRMSVGDGEIMDEDDEDRSGNGFNTKAVGLRGNEELPLKYKIKNNKHSMPMEGDSHTPTRDSHSSTRSKHMHRHLNFDIMILFGFGLMILIMYKIMRFVLKMRAHNMATTGNPYMSTERKLRVPLPSYFLPSSYYTTVRQHVPSVPRQHIPSVPNQDIPPIQRH